MRSLVFMSVVTVSGMLLAVSGCGGKTTTTSSSSGGDGGTAGSGGQGGQGAGGQTTGVGGAVCVPEIEICDGFDNDCNGAVDDVPDLPQGCQCDNGDTQACYTGPAGSAGVGTCAMGTQPCVGGLWGACVDQVIPVAEACNLLDDDCNGTVDDMGVASCGFGACKADVPKCVAGQAQTCVPVQPSVEVCDGLDNNCNGITDESDPMVGASCLTGEPGVCSVGKLACANKDLECVGEQGPGAEICDGLDNDCNGSVDDVPGGCLFEVSGVANDVPIADLVGWTQCYLDDYGNYQTQLSTILGQCNKAKLLMGCRVTGSDTLQVMAHAPRADVIFDTGTGNVLHNANGVGWYYNDSHSWGFAQQGDPVERNSCDTHSSQPGDPDNPEKRMCWHTGGGNINDGWRCGANVSIFNNSYERLVFQAD